MMANQNEILTSSSSIDKHVLFLKSILDEVTDPEIPVLTINEMGILRNVQYDGETVVVTITPTYSGCPAMDQITEDIGLAKHWANVAIPSLRCHWFYLRPGLLIGCQRMPKRSYAVTELLHRVKRQP